MDTIKTDKLANTAAPEDDIVIRLSGISKKYNLYNSRQDRLKEALHPLRKKYHHEFYALNDINLEVKRGEILGIMGKNGSGKSTLLKVISSILTPTAGRVEVKGKVVPLLELGSGFNPEYTGLENIYFYSAIMGYTREQIDSVVDDIINFAEIEQFIYQPLKTYSSGMKARLAFAVSVNIDPEILILDEVLSVGDELFRRKCYAKMEQFFKRGKTVLFVSHSAGAINELCTRAILIERGNNILDGPAKFVTMYYQKLLYSADERRESVLGEIKRLNKDDDKKNNFVVLKKKEGNKDKKKINEYKDLSENYIIPEKNETNKYHRGGEAVAYYVEGFKSKSTVKHMSCDVELYDISIKTTTGRIVNHLVSGDEYAIEFFLRFGVELKEINIGINIKDEKGKILAGMSTRNSKMIIPKVKKNDIVKASWNFECIFLTGLYYVDVGVNQVSKSDGSFILKHDDVINFKIIDNNKMEEYKFGFIDLKIKPHIDHERVDI